MDQIPTLLRRLRRSRGWNQTQLAEELGVDQSTVSRWERGKDAPNFSSRAQLAQLMGVSLEELSDAEQSSQKSWTLYATVIGAVQAGDFVTTLEWPVEQQYRIQVPATLHTQLNLDYSAFEVRGDSMDAVYPDGSIVIIARVHDFPNVELRTGDRVVVIQPGDGDDFEATLKEIVVDNNKQIWLWPRSSNPLHQTPVPYKANHDEFDQSREAEIHGVVIASVIYEPALQRFFNRSVEHDPDSSF